MVALLDIKNLEIAFPPRSCPSFPVKQVNMSIPLGAVLGVVGQSGSGKSLTALAILGMVPSPGLVTNGTIQFSEKNLLKLKLDKIRKIRGQEIFLIFQGCGTALTPSLTIGKQLAEVFVTKGEKNWARGMIMAQQILEQVNLDPRVLHLYPFELSGGMRQRVMIAMAAALRPRLLIADEPTTGLDMVTQAEILRLFREMRTRHNVSIMFISHDLRVVGHMADEITVMFQGKTVDHIPVSRLASHNGHSHTRELIAACKSLTYQVTSC